MDDKTGTRVCIIGAGPSGLLTVRRFLQLGDESPEVVCYEKQSTWGGQWNFTWKTGTDQSGEAVHSSFYRNMVSNNPKECIQLPEYTFDDHFGQSIPSHISVPVMKSYLHDNLRLEDLQTSLFPKHLYKGMVWLKGGNQRLLYLGMQLTIHSLPVLDIQAVWSVRYITGINPLNKQRMSGLLSVITESTEEVEQYLEIKQDKLNTVTCEVEGIDFMNEYFQAVADEIGYKIDLVQYDDDLKTSLIKKADNIMTYRDCQYTCGRTKVTSPKPKTPWRQRFEDGVEGFLQ